MQTLILTASPLCKVYPYEQQQLMALVLTMCDVSCAFMCVRVCVSVQVAVTIFSFPPDKGNVGTAAYLDVFGSIHSVVTQLKKQG